MSTGKHQLTTCKPVKSIEISLILPCLSYSVLTLKVVGGDGTKSNTLVIEIQSLIRLNNDAC